MPTHNTESKRKSGAIPEGEKKYYIRVRLKRHCFYKTINQDKWEINLYRKIDTKFIRNAIGNAPIFIGAETLIYLYVFHLKT